MPKETTSETPEAAPANEPESAPASPPSDGVAPPTGADEEGWQEQTAHYFEFTKGGQSIAGKLRSAEPIMFDGRPVQRYTLETAQGNFAFLGGAQLDPQMSAVEVGTMVKIVYEGTAKTRSGFGAKMFRVFTK